MSEEPSTTSPDGVDVARVTDWFETNADALAPLQFDLIAGGRSNMTYKVTDAKDRAWVLRRPPLGHVLATAHDMSREHRIIDALGPTDVPVPAVVGLCTDEAVNGAPFYVMAHVDGLVVRNRADGEALAPSARIRASESIVDVMARIHAIDVDAVGLGDLGRKEAYIPRQLKRWHSQFEASAIADLELVHELHEKLAGTVPEQQGATIVHGDYRLDNCMIDASGEVIAVLDWEICTLGDPLADVGLLQVYWSEPGDAFAALIDAPTLVEGFLSKQDTLDRYAAASGRDLSRIDYYVAFGYWKLACILAGVYTRWAGGAMGKAGANTRDFEGFKDQVRLLADASAAALDRAR
jgi:aminoglycoside phosphotransferase (APT) family kinase protein